MFTLGQVKGFGFLCALALWVFGLVGCGAEAPGAEVPGEEVLGAPTAIDGSGEAVGRQEQALTGIACDWTKLWDFFTPPLPQSDGVDYEWGPTTSSYYCALTRLDGLDEAALGYRHNAFVGHENGRWFIKGQGAKMTCAPLNCFSHPSSQAVTWLQSTYWVSSSGTKCSANSNMFWNDAASVLNGVRNSQSPGGWAGTRDIDHRIYVNDGCATPFGAAVEGFGTTFYVGVPGTGDYTELSAEKAVGQNFPVEQDLIGLNEGLCYFTGGGYQLAGSTAKIHIKQVVSTNRWVLSSTGSPRPRAYARCIYYNQN